ncbi:hypothetical protein SprV_0100144000 [Sparganum proliferum]
MARVTDKGTVSKALAVTDGVKWGRALASTLFNLLFPAMLTDAYRDGRPGICITYRINGHLLNSRCMQTSRRLPLTTTHDPLFADDCAVNTESDAEMRRSVELFTPGCANFGLTIDTDKTLVMHQSLPSPAYSVPRIHVNGTHLRIVDKFAY